MPVRPENKDRYPASWKEISHRIRFERAGGRCECEGECGHDHREESFDGGEYDVPRCQARHGFVHPVTRSPVVLTTAHLDHQPENCGDDNLRAMCQRCHNSYDAPVRRAGILERRRELAAVGDFFDGDS